MRKLVLLSFLIYALGYSQNKQVLYDFSGLPQTLMINPGAEVSAKFHVGFPLLSQISIQGGFTGFSAYDLFADDGIHINDKIKDVIDNLGKSEFMTFNQQLEIVNVGFRLPNNDYLSFGYYQEFDILFKMPRDMVDLFYDGNTNIGRRYSFNRLATRAELLGVFHLGISKKINSKLQIGVRAKIYSSVFNMSSKNNSAIFSTDYGTNNIYKHNLEYVNFLVQTSGIFFEDNDEVTPDYIKSNLLFGGNLGLGIDVGFTHHYKKHWTLSGSIQDIGFVSHKNNIESYQAKGNYSVEGIQLNFDEENPEDYWQDLKDEFEQNIVVDTLYTKYVTLRPAKLNGAVSYGFGRPKYDDCRFLIDQEGYSNKVGFQLFSTLGAVHSYFAGTLFYERRVNKNLQAKFTYTVDPFSFANLGMGISTRVGAFNYYLTADNLLNLSNVYAAKSMSVQMGINFIFNDKI